MGYGFALSHSCLGGKQISALCLGVMLFSVYIKNPFHPVLFSLNELFIHFLCKILAMLTRGVIEPSRKIVHYANVLHLKLDDPIGR